MVIDFRSIHLAKYSVHCIKGQNKLIFVSDIHKFLNFKKIVKLRVKIASSNIKTTTTITATATINKYDSLENARLGNVSEMGERDLDKN